MLESLSVRSEVLRYWDRLVGPDPIRATPFEISRHFKSICTPTTVGRWIGALADSPEVPIPWMVAKTLRSIYFNLDAPSKDRRLAQALRISPELISRRREFTRPKNSDFGQFIGSILLPVGFETQHFDIQLLQARLRVLELIRKYRYFELVAQRLSVASPLLLESTGTLTPEAQQSILEIQNSQRLAVETPGLVPLPSALLNVPGATKITDLSDVVSAEATPAPAESSPAKAKVGSHQPPPDQPNPNSSIIHPRKITGAAVVLRKSSSPALQAFVDSARVIDLDFDTKFLASGLSVNNRWSVAFGTSLITRISNKRYIVKAVEAEIESRQMRLKFRLVDHTGPEPEVRFRLGNVEILGARTWAAFGAAILAYFFTDQQDLTTRGSRLDWEILHIRFGLQQWSARYVCTKEVKLLEVSQLLRPAKTTGAGQSPRPHDTRSHFQVRRGKRVPISSYRTGGKQSK